MFWVSSSVAASLLTRPYTTGSTVDSDTCYKKDCGNFQRLQHLWEILQSQPVVWGQVKVAILSLCHTLIRQNSSDWPLAVKQTFDHVVGAVPVCGTVLLQFPRRRPHWFLPLLKCVSSKSTVLKMSHQLWNSCSPNSSWKSIYSQTFLNAELETMCCTTQALTIDLFL